MTYRSISLLAGVLLLGLATSRSATGQEQKKPPLTFGSEVSIVAIPVFVTDKDGRSVSGLTAQDFEVEDGGKPAAIQGFLAISGDGPAQSPTGTAGGATLLSSRRQFVLLFDIALSRAIAVERSRVAARKFLEEEIRPGDLVAVVAATAQGMKMLLGLSPDRTQVIRAINSVGRGDVARNRDPLGILFDANLESSLVVSADADSRDGQAQDSARAVALLLMRQQRQAYAQQISQFLGGFQGLAQQLDAIRGRKNVILFSEGFDTTIITGAQGNEKGQATAAVISGNLAEVDSDTYFGSAGGQNALSGVFATMRGADVVVHAIDLGSAGADTMDLSSQEGSAFNPTSGLDSLATFAFNTGGRFIKGTTDVGAALRDIADATKAYYVLAFSPTSADVGKARKLKIKVKQSGLKVNHRPTYLIPDPKKPDLHRQGLQASEIIAKGLSGGPILLSAYAMPYRSPQNGLGVPIVIQIPPEAFTEPLKRKQINFELFGYLVDDKGTVSDFFRATPALDPATLGAKLKADGLQILTTFGAVPGNYEVRLLLRDPESQKFGALRLPVVVPDFSSTPFVSSPMVTGDPFARVALPTVTDRRPNREIPFRIDARPFTVEATPVLKKGTPREICVFKSPSTGKADEFRVVLTGADGVEKLQSPEGLKITRDADGFDRVVFSISPEAVGSGEYLMKVSVGPTTSLTTSMRVQ
ncbi:MAG: VWA domain-containing protein [Vicinamibacteria bacterium]|nr:VWA domain-containing protein [Vicinamibacteria bacterium]